MNIHYNKKSSPYFQRNIEEFKTSEKLSQDRSHFLTLTEKCKVVH